LELLEKYEPGYNKPRAQDSFFERFNRALDRAAAEIDTPIGILAWRCRV